METINKIWEILTTLTEESQIAVINKCEEYGLDINRGDISISESYINLNHAHDILVDAIEKNKLSQFPISIQKVLLSNLEAISNFQVSILSGKDEIINIVNAIEQLYANIWKYNFHNLSGEFLGYVTKMNQLKNQETKANHLKKELEKGILLKQELEDLLTNIKNSSIEVQSILNNSLANNEHIKQNLDKSIDNAQNSSAHLATIQQNDTAVIQLLSNSKTSSAEINTLELKIKEFFNAITEYKIGMESVAIYAKDNIESNKTETNNLINKLNEIENQIKDQLEKATGFSLFHSFQTRQSKLKESKDKWIYAISFVLAISICLTIFIALTTTSYGIAFYLKLSASIPIVYAITFCSIQYSRERKLEEEYAFKSNISISLIPYKDLVEKLIDSTNPLEREKYTKFIIDSINNVFTSPTDKIFEKNNNQSPTSESSLKHFSNSIDAIVKPLEPLLKLLKH